MKIAKVNECMEHAKKAIGDGLVVSTIVSYADGQTICQYHSDAKSDALISQITTFLQQVLEKAGIGSVNEYFMIDLQGVTSAVIIVFDKYCWAICVDKTICPLGMLLNVHLPDLMKDFNDCL